MSMKTLIENGTVVGWQDGRHCVVDKGQVVFDGNSILFVGCGYDGPVDARIDARGRLVIPGFVNTHLHATDTPFMKGVVEEASNLSQAAAETNFGTLYKMLPAVRHALEPEDQIAGAECAFAELARTGSTTIVELGFDFEVRGDGNISISEEVARAAVRIGLRCYSGPRYRSMHYGAGPDGGVWYKAYPRDGWDRFEACVDFCERWNGKFDDRLRTMLAPGQIDTCNPDLLRETRRVADSLRVPIQVHAGQSPNEFERIRSAHGMTTVQYMQHTGLLGPDLIIGHGQIMTADGKLANLSPDEVSALRDSRSTVAHLPWVKARRGGVIDSIQKYKQMGIRQSLGTDSFPFDMFNEMRTAAVMCRIVEHSADVASSEDIFTMATVGGADALGRDDLGRLAAGCKADIVLIRTDTLKAAPLYDPFKFLVLAASGDDVDTVIVDGRTVVSAGEVVGFDAKAAISRLNDSATRVRQRVEL